MTRQQLLDPPAPYKLVPIGLTGYAIRLNRRTAQLVEITDSATYPLAAISPTLLLDFSTELADTLATELATTLKDKGLK